MARSYTKRDLAYWNGNQSVASAPAAAPQMPAVPFPDIAYGATHTSMAADINGGGDASITRQGLLNAAPTDAAAFANLRAMASPYAGGYDATRDGGYVGCADAIALAAKAWSSVSVVRNAIEVAVEFSSQPLYVRSSNATVQTFFTEWLRAIQISRLKEQFFREYYRSGNVFLYRFDGKFGPKQYRDFQSAFAAKENRVPIRYELLNPSNVFVPAGISFPYTYVRLLSTFECERLRNPITEQDRQVFNDLSEEAKEQIRAGGANTFGIYMPMQPNRLRFTFYKKQDYEPLGVPMVWPVLPDIEWKLSLTKMDKLAARSMERGVLLMNMGEAPSKENGGKGVNPGNFSRLQNLLQNPTLCRALVVDYTVKGQWLIPPIEEILGPAKYQVVNEDIQNGLQSILGGADKFANAQIKAKIFIQRLGEGQDRFLNDFLMPEVESICSTLGFRSVPEIGFQKIELQDEAVMARIYAQLAQIGVLTPEQSLKAIDTQLLPDSEELVRGHTEAKKLRDKGLFEPLIGGQKDEGAGPNGRPAGSGGGKQTGTRKSSPIGTSKAAYQDVFSMKALRACMDEASDLESEVRKSLKKHYRVKGSLNDVQKNVAHLLTKSIIATRPRDQWVESIAAAIAAPPAISPEVSEDMDHIVATYDSSDFPVGDFEAAILRHCRTDAPETA